ncbi:MAG: LCP family protein [Blautia sp.]|nr:LCP family protein [Blautia sp.]
MVSKSRIRRRSKDWIPGAVITALLFIAAVVFMVLLYRLALVPSIIMTAGALALLVLLAVTEVLLFRTRYKARFSIGLFIAFILAAILSLGIFFVGNTMFTVGKITGESVQVTRVGVYVRSDDPAVTLQDVAGRTIGVLGTLDREVTDQALTELTKTLGAEPQTTDYKGLTDLMDALRREDAGAVLVNQGYLDVIQEIDGYSDILSQIKEVGSLDVKMSIDRGLTEESGAQNAQAQTSNGTVYTIFISGIDTRDDEMIPLSRSDVNIIATINMDTRQMLLVSTPRDYFVPLSISNGVPDKLTHAGIYGIDVCMKTLSMLYDMNMYYYFRVNFGGFVKIIDALGGITVHSDYDFNAGSYHYVVGDNQMDGEMALAFSRERHAFPSGDRQRGRNQMAVIRAVVRKALSPDLLRNYSSVLSSLNGCFGTNISYEEIARALQRQLRQGGDWNVITYSVDGTGDTQVPYSMSQEAYVMVPDYDTVEAARTLMEKVRNSERITQEEANAMTVEHVDTAETETKTEA